MKKPKDVTDLAIRLASAAATPLVAPAPAPIAPAAVEATAKMKIYVHPLFERVATFGLLK